MITLIVSILIGWLMLKLLWPRAPIDVEPPSPQLVIHLHLVVHAEDSGGRPNSGGGGPSGARRALL